MTVTTTKKTFCDSNSYCVHLSSELKKHGSKIQPELPVYIFNNRQDLSPKWKTLHPLNNKPPIPPRS